MEVFKISIQLIILAHAVAVDLNIKDLKLSIGDFDMNKILDNVMKPLNLSRKISEDINFNAQTAITLAPFYRRQGEGAGVPAANAGEVKPVPVPMYVMQQAPVVVPMRTYFERVVHDHPPINKIRKLIEADERRWNNKKNKSDSSVSESTESDTSSSTYEIDCTDKEIDPVDYYDDLIHIKS